MGSRKGENGLRKMIFTYSLDLYMEVRTIVGDSDMRAVPLALAKVKLIRATQPSPDIIAEVVSEWWLEEVCIVSSRAYTP